MNKTILLGIAISGSFIVGILSANPVVEAVSGWQAAVADHETRISEIENVLDPIERVQVSGNLVTATVNNVPVQSVAQCPPTHPILIGGSYDIDSSFSDFNFMLINTDFDISSNSFTVSVERRTSEINPGVRAHALCAKLL